MKNTMKKFLCMMLVAILCVTCVPVSRVSATDSSISIGGTITLGTYNGEPITWICVDIDENGPLMMTKDVLCKKQFDAPGTSSTYHTDGWGYIRRERGSNCWYDSSIRQWLNTNGAVSYTHCPPSYSAEHGFMTNFTSSELSVVKSVTQKAYVNSWETKRSGYVHGGSQEVPDSYNITGLNRNYSSYWYQNVTDSFFLLNQEQLYSVYKNNSNFLVSSVECHSRVAGNSGASYENVFIFGGSNANNFRPLGAYESYGIRPAFYLDVDAWEQKEVFVSGYNFNEDSYNFPNDVYSISKKYYTSMYGYFKGDALYKKFDKNAHGVCFGMAYSASSIFQNCPSPNSFGSSAYAKALTKTSFSDVLKISLLDFIFYSHIYQFSDIIGNQRKPVNAGIESVYREVKNSIDRDTFPILIELSRSTETGLKLEHTICAVGIEGDDILVYDSNEDNVMKINISENEWDYSGGGWYWSSKNGDGINYIYADTFMYQGIVEEQKEFLSYHKLLVMSKNNINLINSDAVEIQSTSKSSKILVEETEDNAYWIDSNEKINLDNSTESSGDFTTLGNKVSISGTIPALSSAKVNFDETNVQNNITFETNREESITFCFSNLNNNEETVTDISLTGTADETEVTATQTETGLVVTGISDGTVTLSKDEKVITTQQIVNAVGDIEIIYDTNGSNNDLDVDYHSHSYTSLETQTATCTKTGSTTYTCSCGDSYTQEIAINPLNHAGETEIRNIKDSTCTEKGYAGDTYCLDCGEKISSGKDKDILGHKDSDKNNSCDLCGEAIKNCSHLCHKTGFIGFIWTIINFFCRIFKTNRICSCGKAHW